MSNNSEDNQYIKTHDPFLNQVRDNLSRNYENTVWDNTGFGKTYPRHPPRVHRQ